MFVKYGAIAASLPRSVEAHSLVLGAQKRRYSSMNVSDSNDVMRSKNSTPSR